MIAMIAANKYNLKKMHAISHFATPRAAKTCHVRLDTDSPLCPACPNGSGLIGHSNFIAESELDTFFRRAVSSPRAVSVGEISFQISGYRIKCGMTMNRK